MIINNSRKQLTAPHRSDTTGRAQSKSKEQADDGAYEDG